MTKDARLDDADLMAGFAAGDQAAARELVARHLPRALSVASRMLGDGAEAQDVAQEAMVRLFRIATEWQPDRARVGTWLYRVVSNLAIDRLRSRRTEPLDAADEPSDDGPAPVDGLMARDRAAALHRGLSRLPERQRLAVTLRHIEELPTPEIAAIMDLSVEAVESLLARGRRALTRELAPHRDAIGFEG